LIHVAGTKGKGSTCAFISSILSQYRITSSQQPSSDRLNKIGLYTSPHLRAVRERIQINQEPLSEAEFAKYFFEVWDRLEESSTKEGRDIKDKPVYFRFLTLMAFHTYLREGVDTAIIEVGVGGEYDSTNIIEKPTCVGITSLGVDHTAMLGDTVEEIAWHKAGVIKEGRPSFTISPQPGDAMRVIRERAAERNSELVEVTLHPELSRIKLGLDADFQKLNASLAIAISASHLESISHPHLPFEISPSIELPSEFKRGLQKAAWPGRCEVRTESNIQWCIDGGHTQESIAESGKWFAGRVLAARSQPSQAPTTKAGLAKSTPPQTPRILIFNQQTRDAGALATTLHQTLTSALASKAATGPRDEPFTHAIFCTNQTYAAAGYKADLVSINTNAEDVDVLTVQKGLAETWAKLSGEGVECLVERSIEGAVGVVRGIAGGTEGDVCVLVTGSVHLVGGFLEVLDGDGA
jgi:folylpolyglutamate synthase